VKFIIIAWMLVCCFGSFNVHALAPEEIKQIIQKARPDLPVIAVRESEISGVYAAELQGGYTLYFSRDGKYFISGELYTIENNQFVSVRELRLKPLRREQLHQQDDAELLVFSPPEDQIKATVWVFTDIDCGWCRKLHQEIPAFNKQGIAVKYLAYPQAGLSSDSYTKVVSAWCSDSPKEALTRAKAGQSIPVKVCPNPVAKQYYLGKELGVSGTPAVIYEDGTLQSGYVNAVELARRLGIN